VNSTSNQNIGPTLDEINRAAQSLAGRIDSNRQDAASRVPDSDLIGQLVGVLGVTAETLQSALNGGKNGDIIDIEPGSEMGTGPTIVHDLDVNDTNNCA
jgi:hypothetical protein